MIKCEKEKGTVELGGGSEIDIAFEQKFTKKTEVAKQKIANGIAEFAMEILFGGKTE